MPGPKSRSGAGVAVAVRRAPARQPVELYSAPAEQMEAFARRNLELVREHGLEGVREHEKLNKVLALCAPGPSLATEPLYAADEVWGCNSAFTWLAEHRSVTAGVGIDQSPTMLKEWRDTPRHAEHYVATTCDPALFEHLLETGRRVRFIHNYVGFPGELDLYKEFPGTFMMGEGSSVVSRSIKFGAYMGFRRIDVYGADCSLGPGDEAHANGETADEAYGRAALMQGDVGGRTWKARPDMLMTACDLARYVRKNPGHVRLMGDTLAVALMGQDEAFLNQVIRQLRPGEDPREETE